MVSPLVGVDEFAKGALGEKIVLVPINPKVGVGPAGRVEQAENIARNRSQTTPSVRRLTRLPLKNLILLSGLMLSEIRIDLTILPRIILLAQLHAPVTWIWS
jgi:hypothetical protein